MEQQFKVAGMTCNGCVASVTKKIATISGVIQVDVNLETSLAKITSNRVIPATELQSVLPEKYTVTSTTETYPEATSEEELSKWKQLKPLFLIFAYLFVAAFLLNYKSWDWSSAMLDFMGLFYIVFSFFKLLDLKGFPESFGMYDPLAKRVPVYGKIYPFIEVVLGLMFLMRIQVLLALFVTLIVLGITTVGVTKSILDKKAIKCACLGTTLNLPMTEATFIENVIMLVMAVSMLLVNL
ncbi:heavy-metal-associated domain-containing protein [Flavobacterium sp. ASW18X]|uniref:heavy-metal-associated domain-containing protein n=1 Tax=Flavobacterium sp. ASW18X TaxID=2572595 RepID=UPI0010AE9FDE|nr:heavy metal-associated domain-containing protein [Flavobacterium sp. ASW18X]TKD60954.1 heavy metal transporter [Flavobacterium sp. ASW18X]